MSEGTRIRKEEGEEEEEVDEERNFSPRASESQEREVTGLVPFDQVNIDLFPSSCLFSLFHSLSLIRLQKSVSSVVLTEFRVCSLLPLLQKDL